MTRINLPALIVASALLATTGHANENQEYRVTRPGILFDINRSSGKAHYCSLPYVIRLVRPTVYLGPARDTRNTIQAFSWLVMNLTADALLRPTGASTRSLIKVLRQWADARGMTVINEVSGSGSNTASLYLLKRTLTPLLMSWSLVRINASQRDLEIVEEWLSRLVDLADRNTGSKIARQKLDAGSCDNVQNHVTSTVPISNC